MRHFLTLAFHNGALLGGFSGVQQAQRWCCGFSVRRSPNTDSLLYLAFLFHETYRNSVSLKNLPLSDLVENRTHTSPSHLFRKAGQNQTNRFKRHQGWSMIFPVDYVCKKSWCKGCTTNWKCFMVQDCNNPSPDRTQAGPQGESCMFYWRYQW